MSLIIDVLILVTIANAAPVLISYVLLHRDTLPIDFGHKLADGNYIFGVSKTWRGVIAAIIFTTLSAIILGFEYTTGLIIAVTAMFGDLFSSFIKRRLKMESSARAPILDQLPEALFPCLALMSMGIVDLIQVIVIVPCFIIIDIILSIVFFKLGIRKRPY